MESGNATSSKSTACVTITKHTTQHVSDTSDTPDSINFKPTTTTKQYGRMILSLEKKFVKHLKKRYRSSTIEFDSVVN